MEGWLSYVFLPPFASDVMLSILHLPKSTLAFPSSIAEPSLTLVVHAHDVVYITTTLRFTCVPNTVPLTNAVSLLSMMNTWISA